MVASLLVISKSPILVDCRADPHIDVNGWVLRVSRDYLFSYGYALVVRVVF